MKQILLLMVVWLNCFGLESPSITEFHHYNKSFSIGVEYSSSTYISIWYCSDISDTKDQFTSKWIATTYVDGYPILMSFPESLVGNNGYFWVSLGFPIWWPQFHP